MKRHTASLWTVISRGIVMLLLAIGYSGGIAASSFMPALCCAPNAGADSGASCHTSEKADSCCHGDTAELPVMTEDVEADSDAACCPEGCVQCFFCHGVSPVLLNERSGSAPLVDGASLPGLVERTLFNTSPPLYHPPRTEKYPAV
jgi:hypothetical protein